MAKMQNHETKKVKVTPKSGNTIPDILTQNKMITGETTMNMNAREIRRAMSFGNVVEVGEGTEIPLDTRNFNDAPAATAPSEDSQDETPSPLSEGTGDGTPTEGGDEPSEDPVE